MRKLLLASLLLTVAGCNLGSITEPDAAAVEVRVMDDRQLPVKGMEVVVSIPGRTDARAVTQRDGTTRVRVATAGTYQVRVIPRDGFHGGAQALSKAVPVDLNATKTVEFTVYRSAVAPPLELRTP